MSKKTNNPTPTLPSRLVIIPCGQGKIWDKSPNTGPTPARHAYTGAPFKVNRRYAETFADRSVVLSAKYGFIDPDFLIPGTYEVTFKRRSTRPVDAATVHAQVRAVGLDQFEEVIVLGGAEYRSMAVAAFMGTEARLIFPFAGLPMGKAMAACNQAVSTRNPYGSQPA